MKCKKCRESDLIIVKCEGRLYGICFFCDEIFHIKQKKNGRYKQRLIERRHVPREVIEEIKEKEYLEIVI